MDGAEFWLLGDGPERDALTALVAELGLGERVRMPGHLPRPEVLRLLAESHVLVHPSLHESGGGVCLEAMAAGRPVVCFDLGGHALAADPERRRALGAAGRARVRDHFVWEGKVAWMADRYRALVGAPAPSGDGLARTAPPVLAAR
jgi:glycosyltransferase involved in cell wall biosynthesis